MEYAFTLFFASQKFPGIPVYGALSATAVIALVTLKFELLSSK